MAGGGPSVQRRRSRRVVEVARQQRLRLRKRRRAEDLLSVGVVWRAVGGDAADDSVPARDQRLLVGRQLGGGVDEARPLRRQLEDAVPRERQVVVGAVEKVAQPRRREGAARVRRVRDVRLEGVVVEQLEEALVVRRVVLLGVCCIRVGVDAWDHLEPHEDLVRVDRRARTKVEREVWHVDRGPRPEGDAAEEGA
eukprot:CAMPEP_0118839260 /NCGR_PEP_ID=MMETSP1162-20130426/68982_1 /TAXON_ID=33656 /ORGANISM="Phaeocystis Sp, Strain CCMP2710" /LENGTH=194 /DNA_ID=CAMNT_0006771227 /DNA_START=75 /DNA_END=659 /DNA_ORIENTATION=+